MDMDNMDDILKQLKNSSANLNANLHIIEEIIPIEEQMRYFDYAKNIRSSNSIANRNYWVSLLFSHGIDIEYKRHCLSSLAGLVDVAAYRAIETYHSSPLEPELANWSALALVESKILISSDLSDEKQVFISTGLGGHNGKLRFFAVIPSADRTDFTELQQEILLREFNFQIQHEKIDVEEMNLHSNYMRVLLLADINKSVKNVFNNIVNECNVYGSFVDTNFMLTNIRQFTDTEIDDFLQRRERVKPTDLGLMD